VTFFEYPLPGGSAGAYLAAGGTALAIIVVVKIVTTVLRRRIGLMATRTRTSIDDVLVDMLAATRMWLTVIVALWVASLWFHPPPRYVTLARQLGKLAIFIQLALWAGAGVTGTVTRLHQRKLAAGETSSLPVIGMLGLLIRVLAWAIALLLMLDNMGVNITALVAGLGIGGIAIALAAQSVLGDLFASISIIFDKPFTVGDFIVVDDVAGTVTQIGLKTTRVRALAGELLVLPNGKLLGSNIHNYTRMQERRIATQIGVSYETTREQVAAIPGIIRAAIEAVPIVRFDRAHFMTFGDSSLRFEFVYIVKVADYNPYMDAQQLINLKIMQTFDEQHIKLAYETRVLLRGQLDGLPALPRDGAIK
jgi:small-conductance mechanosensitive channel